MKLPLSIWLRRPWQEEIPFWVNLACGAVMVCTYTVAVPWLLPCCGIAGALAGATLCTICAGVLPLYFVPFQGGLRQKLGIRKINRRSLYRPAFLGFLWIFLLMNLATLVWKKILLAWHIPFEEQQPLLLLIEGANGQNKIMLFLTVCILVPVMEELFFRRYLNGCLRKGGAWTQLIAGAVIFALLHRFILGLPALIIMGVVFQLLYSKSRNFAVPVLCHAFVNTFAFIASLF